MALQLTVSLLITIDLSNLSADLELELQNSLGTVLDSSTNGGSSNENISYSGSSGSYRIRVYGHQGAVSDYFLRLQIGTTQVSEPDIDVADSTLNVTEGGTTQLRARLTSEPASNVVITASESDSDISVSPASRTFTPSNWNTYQSWTVTGVQDSDTSDDTATITLTASGGSTDTASVSVAIADDDSIPDPNVAPTVSISTSDQDVDGGDTVQLNSSSLDSDGTIASGVWTGSGTFVNASSDNTSWTAPAAQTTDQDYVLRRTATDNDGATGSATVTITVLGTGVTPPTEGVTYDFRHREVGAASWTTVEDIDALTYTTINLDLSLEYEAQVKAKNSAGESDWSPSGTSSPMSDEGITFDFRYREVGTPTWTTVEDIDALTYTTIGLDPSTEYEAQVKAKK